LSKWRAFYENKFKSNQMYARVMGDWYKSSGPKRQYNTIKDYKKVTSHSNKVSEGKQVSTEV